MNKSIGKMTLLVFLFIVLTVSVFSVYGCDNGSRDEKNIKLLNDNFNGEFKFTQEMPVSPELEAVPSHVTGEDSIGCYNGFLYMPGFGCYALESIDGLTRYTVSGYPDCLDDYKITYFRTEDAAYKIFGFSVGSNTEEAKNILIENGYSLVESDSNVLMLKNGKISFALTGERVITYISISLKITNKDNVVF